MSAQPGFLKNIIQTQPSSSDPELWTQIRQGDVTAFSSVFKKYYPLLYLFAGKFVKDVQAAEHIVQDLFITLWIKRDSIQISSSLKAYLYTSVKNRSLDYIKQKGLTHLPVQDSAQHQDAVVTPEGQYLEKEFHRAVHEAIDKLPEKCRQIYLMRRYNDLKYDEIAEILNISVNTVKTQLKRALKSLQKQLAHLLTPIFRF
jgi:RNA polymerase sigma-70 factor (ECF subfamily)